MRPSLFQLSLKSRSDSYYQNGRMSPALLRARRPYFYKNAATFVILGGISLGIYVKTYNFLMQDDFEDIPVPPISDSDLAVLKKEYEASKEQKK